MFEARDIMTTELVTVDRKTPVYEAVEKMVGNDVTGLPVVDDNMTLVGIITEKDVLKLFQAWIDESATVEQFMSDNVVSFETDTNLIEICEFLVNTDFRRVAIVSQGRLKGVISRKDLIKYITEPIG